MDEQRSNVDPRRREPTGDPVVRGDPEITGSRAAEAIEFDPEDEESLETATTTVREFARGAETSSPLEILRGAAACATLVRGESSYKAAVERAGDCVTVNFLRKWTRVHDLPIEIRRYIALGTIVPSAAEHVARVEGEARFLLAWAIIDHELSVRDVRSIVGRVADGASMTTALEQIDAVPGEKCVSFPVDLYHELRLEAAAEMRDVDEIVAEAVEQWLHSTDDSD